MKKAVYILLTFVILASTATAEKWELIDNNTTVVDPKGRNSEFNVFGMVELNGTIFNNNKNGRNSIVKSSDNCMNWDSCVYAPFNNIGASTTFYDLVKHKNDLFALADSGRIYHSFDGGTNWDFTYLGDEYKHPIQHLKFVNDSVGFLGHMQNIGFLKTTDAGRTWNPLPDASGIFPEIFRMYNFVALDENTIYFVGAWTEGYYFFKTTNGGVDWEKVEAEPFESYPQVPAQYNHLAYREPYIIVEKRYKPSAMGNVSIMKSKDFINWEPIFISDTISGGKFIHDIKYYGSTIIGIGTRIFIISTDNGESWLDLYDESDEFYNRNNSPSSLIYKDGYVYSPGTIIEKDEEGLNRSIRKFYRYNLDSKSSVESFTTKVNIYPNPAKEEIKINYDKMINSIEILDLNGKRVLSNQYLAPQMEQSLNIDYLQSGTYFIRINDKVYKRFVKE